MKEFDNESGWLMHAPWRRKWVSVNDVADECIESDVEGYPRISMAVEPHGMTKQLMERRVEPPIMLVPYDEFRQLVFHLPVFAELPILHNAWTAAGECQYFVAKCFEDDAAGRCAGDELLVNTEGHWYPRYKATVYRTV